MPPLAIVLPLSTPLKKMFWSSVTPTTLLWKTVPPEPTLTSPPLTVTLLVWPPSLT